MSDENRTMRPPSGFIVMLVITALSAVAWLPYALAQFKQPEIPSDTWVLTLLYPIYAILSVYLAYKCYNDRSFLSWILIIFVWLSLIAEIVLVNTAP